MAGVCVFVLTACSSLPPLALPDHLPAQVALGQVPVFAQPDNWCGPAALASLLNVAGVAITPQQLAPQVFLPGREGAINLELLAATRRQGLMPYVLRGDMGVLLQELAAGNPVLVLLDLSLPPLSRWHYVVLTGYDRKTQQLTMISAGQADSRIDWLTFRHMWARGQNWAMLALPPGRLPATAEPLPLLQQGSALEQMGKNGEAGSIYQAASKRWPDHSAIWFAAGNVAYRAGDLSGAEADWRRSLVLDADAAAARHNLIELLWQQRRQQEALLLLREGLRRDPSQPLLLPLADRLQQAGN